MENKAIDKMTVQEMAQEILNNLKERKGTEAELKVSLRDCTLLRAIASEGNHNVIEINTITKTVLNASVSAIYFADNRGYKSYHYDIIRSLTKLDEPTDQDIARLFKELNPECQ